MNSLEVLEKVQQRLAGDFNDCIDELNNSEKKLKALEIIKNKGVDITEIMIQNTLYAYNRFASVHPNNNYHRKQLTQEEYNLLKEVLKDE